LLFAFTFSYKTVKYIVKVKAEVTCAVDMDCENEKENSIEKDEIVDPFCNSFLHSDKLILTEETFLPKELIINFSSANYSNPIYSPPEILS
jgi:hypothetical protein